MIARHDPHRPDYHACTGCNLCVLPCPVFRETRDLSLTVRGRALALQGGASLEEIAPSLAACVACGACEPVCPEEIDTVGHTLALRARLGAPLAPPLPAPSGEAHLDRDVVLLPGRLPELEARRVAEAIGAQVSGDSGEDVAHALEAGLPIDEERLARFLGPLRAVRRLVVAEGLLHAPLRRWLPRARVEGVATALLALPAVRGKLGPADLLVLEGRGYHADFARLVGLYDRVRKETGAALNLDLHRIAIPTGAGSVQAAAGTGGLDVVAQVAWLLEGRCVERIVAESHADAAALRAAGTVPVVTLAGLA